MDEEQVPRRLGGYRIIAKLGAGGMANVYLGMQSGMAKFKKLVVVKVLHAKYVNNPEFLDMFLNEARLAARLNHPNVVNTYEVGEDQGLHFMAMEYLEGQPFNAVIKKVKRKNLQLEHSLKILVDVLAGLHYAHELRDFDGTPLGVVHRDVSPQNIFVTYDGNVKLVDFGVAKAACSDQETRAGVIKGKIAYLAPEQASSQAVDRRADIFAVGVLLWESMAGKRFASGSIDVATIHKRVTGGEPRILEVVTDAPAALARICDKAIALKPEDRYATALEMKAELESFLEERRERHKAHSLAVLITESFAEERSTIQTVIEEHARVESSIPPSGEASLPTINLRGSEVSSPSASLPSTSTATASTVADAQPRRSAAPWVALAAVTVVAGASIAYAIHSSSSVAQPATASAAPLPSAASPAQADQVELIILASPPNALITLDGTPVSGNPFRAKVDRSSKMHKVRATADGYEPQEKAVVFDGDTTVKLTLDPVKEEADSGDEKPKLAPVAAAPPKAGAKGPAAPEPAETAPAPASGPPKVGDRLRTDRNDKQPTRTIDDQDPYAQ